MSSIYEITAPAKVNIYLKITGKLPNGYHRLNTIMQEISLSDSVVIEIDASRAHDIELKCKNMGPIPNEKNLCYKAASRYLAAYRKKTGILDLPFVSISVTKAIPSEAGLGGGSSDAAAVLLALDEFFENPFTPEELNTVAANIGADTPFFLYGGASVCEGFGEIITPMNSLSGIPMILIKPAKGVSTPACFSSFDKFADENGIDFDEARYASLKEEVSAAEDPISVLKKYHDLLVNDLQAPAIEYVPDISIAKSLLEANGAAFALMSGSGSAVFGLFENSEARDKAFETLSASKDVADRQMKIYQCETC